jgi:hypothetical protein
MSIITVKRTVRPTAPSRQSLLLRSFREITRGYFASEGIWELVIEVLLFAIIAAISAWPIMETIGALHDFLQRAGS